MDHQLPVFPSFNYEADKANASSHWNRWINRLENLFVAMGLEEDDDKPKRALLLHYAGERVYDIYDAEKGTSGDT